MFVINKITCNHVIDFAAEELKKYLRMMMPFCGEIDIAYNPDANDGFRLGLMSDFGIDTSEADNVDLDDIIHIDTDKCGGIIAGSNPRSVLLAVYRYLTINGCRWLYPGVDGEFIPVKDITSVSYHKMADCRYRGQCNEGAEAQHLMMDAIDFTPKIGMNIFMIEFENPKFYYDVYYNHNENNTREPEPVSAETILQWKRLCEAEISKRGLQFHDMGHGWTAEPFGLVSTDGWTTNFSEDAIPEESRQYVAMIDGKRELFYGTALNTNFCMSNPEARKIVVDYIVDYAALATNVDYLHVWLADGFSNHCECDSCREKIVSDWYVTLMNELDDALTSKGLTTRIVFICYADSTWAPKTVKLKNPERFSLLLGAITRDYTEPVAPNLDIGNIELSEFELNRNRLPNSVNQYIAHARKWMDWCKVPSFVYEYHFYVAQYCDLGSIDAARIVYEDVKGYKSNGCDGIVEDCSQRSFFPNGFPFFVYGNTLFDVSATLDEMTEDYFSHAYGDDWREVYEFFCSISRYVDFRYLNGKSFSDAGRGRYYNPELVESFKKAVETVNDFEGFVRSHMNMPYRVQTVSYRILNRFLEYVKGILEAMILKVDGKETEALNLYNAFLDSFGRYETELELYYDQYLMSQSLNRIFRRVNSASGLNAD